MGGNLPVGRLQMAQCKIQEHCDHPWGMCWICTDVRSPNFPRQLLMNSPIANVSFASYESYYLYLVQTIVPPIIINLLCPVIHTVAQTTFHYCQRGPYPTTQIDLLLICYHLSAVTFLAIAQCPFPQKNPTLTAECI